MIEKNRTKPYTIDEVGDKIKKYLCNELKQCPKEEEEIIKEKLNNLKVNPQMATVPYRMSAIKNCITKCCNKMGIKYHANFDKVLETLEGAILSSECWFSNDSFNRYETFDDFVKVSNTQEKKFYEDFSLYEKIQGNEFEKHYRNKVFVAIGQKSKFQEEFYRYLNGWLFLSSIQFTNINSIDTSDPYHKNSININRIADKPVIRTYDSIYTESTTLICTRERDYKKNSQNKYTFLMDKFHVNLIVFPNKR